MNLAHIKVLKVGENLLDVFTNDGWEEWTRLLKKDGRLIHLKGAKLPKIVYSYIEKEMK